MNRARVLVVDDHRDMADGIGMLLSELPLEVAVTYSARGALSQLEQREFALVVSDVRMPRAGGLQLLDDIRARWPATRVILLTAFGTIDSAVAALKQGAVDYLTKPFDNRDLLRVVERCLAQAPAGQEAAVEHTIAALTARLSPDDLFDSLTDALSLLRTAAQADDGELFLLEPDGGDAVLSICVGPDGDAMVERTRFQPNEGFPGIVATTARPLTVPGQLADDARYLRQGVLSRGIRSYACVPLAGPRGPLGSIHLLSRRTDFPVARVQGLLERAAGPIANVLRAGLATLRQSIDQAAAAHPEGSPAQLRAVLDCIGRTVGAVDATLALANPETGLPARMVSTGPATTICSHGATGDWASCPSLSGAHGFIAERGRRGWPARCRQGVPLCVTAPCCLPLTAHGRLHGLITFDLGRQADERRAEGRLVSLLVMAQQAAIRLAPHHAGIPLEDVRTSAAPRARAAAPVELELRCLGPFAVLRNGERIAPEQFPRSKALGLLKLLALHAGAPLNRDYLVEQLWPGVEPATGTNRLHVIVHTLRHVIEPQSGDPAWRFVRNRGDVYYLDTTGPIEIDLLQFRRLLERARRPESGRPDEAIDALERATALYRGDLFADDPYAEWCAEDRREVRERQVVALVRLARLHAGQGDLERPVAHARAALRLAPYRTDLLRWLVEWLERSGRAAEARAILDECLPAAGETGRPAPHDRL